MTKLSVQTDNQIEKGIPADLTVIPARAKIELMRLMKDRGWYV